MVTETKVWAAVAAVLLMACAAPVHAESHKARDAAWREEIRHELYVPKTLPQLDAKVWGTFSPMAGVLADRVTYDTADGMVVPAIVYRPDPVKTYWMGKLPGLVVVNGHGADKFSWYAFYSGLLFAKAGGVVVTYDPIGEGERNAERKSRAYPSPHDRIVPPPPGVSADDWGQRLAGLMQVDLLQAVSYLVAQPEVDPKRIATLGYSMGAFITGIEGAYDLRVHAVVLSGGGVYDGPGEYYDSNKLPCQGPPYHALKVLGDRGAVLYDLNADRGPMLVMNGDVDRIMDIPHHDATWFDEVRARAEKLRGTTKNMFTNIFYPGVGHRPSWVDRDGMKWLNEQVHFAFWNTPGLIDAAGETHISEWITANDVDISKSFFREEREGGIEAVGKGFPAIPRADLMVLPETEWEQMKDRLTYEAWAAKTMAAQRCDRETRAAEDRAGDVSSDLKSLVAKGRGHLRAQAWFV